MSLAFLFIRYREAIGNMIGEPDWAIKIGGIYNVMILLGILMFFWSIASITGTTDVLFYPIVMFLPH
ncbi:hypothetical protein EXS65_00930 [Candidatus Peribacteria bacterium]|nr:hypothetical protein [Candidatus Peribacteria bacterium]